MSEGSAVPPLLLLLAFSLLAASLPAGCLSGGEPGLGATGQAWPDGSRIFEDDRWLGGDGAITVPLGGHRVLWLFGDSQVAPDGERSRDEAFFVSNTVAIQRGLDPSAASMAFHWREQTPGDTDPVPPPLGSPDPQPRPRPFVPDERGGEIAYWPGHGAMVGDTLVWFYTRIERGEGPFGFEGRGWTAYTVRDPGPDPLAWDLQRARTSNPFGNDVTVGSGSVLVQGEHVLAYAHHEVEDASGVVHHEPWLARWPVEQVLAGNLTRPAWYVGQEEGWVAQGDLDGEPAALWSPGAPGWTVHHDPVQDVWIQVQLTGFPTGPIEARTAPEPTGPWSEPTTLHTPPENAWRNVTTYLGYAHPGLAGADLVVGYSTNALDESAREAHPSVGLPRLARVTLR